MISSETIDGEISADEAAKKVKGKQKKKRVLDNMFGNTLTNADLRYLSHSSFTIQLKSILNSY